MKNKFYLLSLITLLLMSSCSSDAPNKTSDSSITNSDSLNTIKDSTTADLNDVPIEDEPVIEQPKPDEEQIKVKKEKIEKSELKDDSCAEILKKYEAGINDFIATKDVDKLRSNFQTWANDPIYNDCKKKNELRKKFEALDEKLKTAMSAG